MVKSDFAGSSGKSDDQNFLTLVLAVNMVHRRVTTPWQSTATGKYQLYNVWQMRSLSSYNKIPKQLLVNNMDYQSGPRGKTYTATGTRSCDLVQSCLNNRPQVALLIIQHFYFLAEIL